MEYGKLVSVGVKDRREVDAVDTETILLSCGYHHSCLIWTVVGNMNYTMPRAKYNTSPPN